MFPSPEKEGNSPINKHCEDIFASGVILFMLLTKEIPFASRNSRDNIYRAIHCHRVESFWKIQSSRNLGVEFSEDLKDFITSLFEFKAPLRLSLSEIKFHPWFLGDVPSHEEVLAEMSGRHEILLKQMETPNEEVVDNYYDFNIFEDPYHYRHQSY